MRTQKPVLQSDPDKSGNTKLTEVKKLSRIKKKRERRKKMIENFSLLFYGPFESPKAVNTECTEKLQRNGILLLGKI